MITPSSIQQVVDSCRIEEVIGDFVTIRKKGVNWNACCPFHQEKTPSFVISPAKGLYKCFGCGKAGNSINFVMEHEQLSYPDAIRYLAKKYNLQLEETHSTIAIEEISHRDNLLSVNDLAKKFFQETLLDTADGIPVQEYLQQRGVSEAILKQFEIGYNSPIHSFTAFAQKYGYSLEILQEIGLTIPNYTIDRFKQRLLFPIHGTTGRIIGFGGRILQKNDKIAKYVNSPESTIYEKGKILYGLFFAKKSIAQQNDCFVVEGYMDVISMHQVGITNVVASSGTSLTTEQVQLLKRFTSNITIFYDGDNAGIKAALRGLDIALAEDMNVRIIVLPPNEDPDSFTKTHSVEEIYTYVEKNKQDFISFKSKILLEDAGNDTAKRAEVMLELLKSVAIIPDAIKQDLFLQFIAETFDVEREALYKELQKWSKSQKSFITKTTNKAKQQHNESEVIDIYYYEQQLLRILVKYANRYVTLRIPSEYDSSLQEEIKIKVGDYIISDLDNDQLTMLHPAYQEIYSFYTKEIEGTFPSEDAFRYHEDPSIIAIITKICFEENEISEYWASKHGIIVQEELTDLYTATTQVLYTYKEKRVLEQINNCMQKIKHTQEEAILTEYIQEIQQLQAILIQIKTLLRRFIPANNKKSNSL